MIDDWMMTHAVPLFVAAQGRLADRFGRIDDERGEGVISVAVAVLIIALLGAVAYAAFKAIFDTAADTAKENVGNVGG
jgi:hypothetical protein